MAQSPTVKLLMEVRKWNRSWNDFSEYPNNYNQPMGIHNFAEYLDSKYKIEINE